MYHPYISKIENALRSHIKEQVENGEIWKEAMLLLPYLIIRFERSSYFPNRQCLCIGQTTLDKCCRIRDNRMNIDQFAHFLTDGLIKVE